MAKSKALVDILIVYSNKIQNHVMLHVSGNGDESSKKTIGLISKNKLCLCGILFFVHFFAIVLHN